MSTKNKTEQDIVNLYQRINVGKNSICVKCKENNKDLFKPVSVWLVGNKFSKQETGL